MLKICISIFILANATTLKAEAAPQKFIAVSVAGYQTERSTINLQSSNVAENAMPSAVWSLMPKGASVEKNFYLAQDDSKQAVQTVLSQFGSPCRKDLGIVIMANSWGSNLANILAFAYAEKCGRLADFFVMVDGVAKPLWHPYEHPVWASRCINYYEEHDVAHGTQLEDCTNKNLGIGSTTNDFHGHMYVGMHGAELGSAALNIFLSGTCDIPTTTSIQDLRGSVADMQDLLNQIMQYTAR